MRLSIPYCKNRFCSHCQRNRIRITQVYGIISIMSEYNVLGEFIPSFFHKNIKKIVEPKVYVIIQWDISMIQEFEELIFMIQVVSTKLSDFVVVYNCFSVIFLVFILLVLIVTKFPPYSPGFYSSSSL